MNDICNACTQRMFMCYSITLMYILAVVNYVLLLTAVESSELCLQRQGSLYTVDIDAQGSLVVSGSTDSMIRLFDARIGAKVRHSYTSTNAFVCNALYHIQLLQLLLLASAYWPAMCLTKHCQVNACSCVLLCALSCSYCR
jgi:uncharacterized membrane protein